MKARACELLILTGLIFISPAYGFDQFSIHNHTPKSLGAGGAYVSIVDDDSAFQLNPGGISRHAESRSLIFHSTFVEKASSWALGGAVIDGLTEDPLHWGFQFNTVHTEKLKMEYYNLASSYNFRDFILIGVTNQLTKFHHSALTSNPLIFTMSAGVLIFATDTVSIGLSVLNPVRTRESGILAPVKFLGGGGFNLKHLRAGLDYERDFSNRINTIRMGVELQPLTASFSLRGGFYREITHGIFGYTTGFTATPTESLGVDFAFLDQLNSEFKAFTTGLRIRL